MSPSGDGTTWFPFVRVRQLENQMKRFTPVKLGPSELARRVAVNRPTRVFAFGAVTVQEFAVDGDDALPAISLPPPCIASSKRCSRAKFTARRTSATPHSRRSKRAIRTGLRDDCVFGRTCSRNADAAHNATVDQHWNASFQDAIQ